MTPRILSFGEIIWDIYSTDKLIGGAGLNFTAHCAKCGADSFMFSAVGDDDLGLSAKAAISGFGVDQRFIKSSKKSTGQCIVTLDEKGVPSYNVLSDVAYDNIPVTDDNIEEINKLGFDALYFGTLIQRSPVSRASLHKLCSTCSFKEKICDVNLRNGCYDSDSARFCLENATVLKISIEEEPQLRSLDLYECGGNSPENIAKAISSKYPQIKYLIITLGGDGAFVYCSDDCHSFYESARPVKVSSTVGAGDSFIAAWATFYLSGYSPKSATKKAVDLSGFVVSKTDAIPSYAFKGGILYEL